MMLTKLTAELFHNIPKSNHFYSDVCQLYLNKTRIFFNMWAFQIFYEALFIEPTNSLAASFCNTFLCLNCY